MIWLHFKACKFHINALGNNWKINNERLEQIQTCNFEMKNLTHFPMQFFMFVYVVVSLFCSVLFWSIWARIGKRWKCYWWGKTTECWERRKQLNERSSAMQISLKHFAYFVLESAFMIVPRFNQVHLIVV